MTVIPRFAASATAEDIAQALQTVGCVIIENLAPVELVDQILAEMDPYIDATPYGSEDFTGRTTKRTGALLARSRASVDLVAHPLILDITQKILGPYADTFQLHLTQIINIGPGGQAQGLHRDQWCFNMFPFPPEMDKVEPAFIPGPATNLARSTDLPLLMIAISFTLNAEASVMVDPFNWASVMVDL